MAFKVAAVGGIGLGSQIDQPHPVGQKRKSQTCFPAIGPVDHMNVGWRVIPGAHAGSGICSLDPKGFHGSWYKPIRLGFQVKSGWRHLQGWSDPSVRAIIGQRCRFGSFPSGRRATPSARARHRTQSPSIRRMSRASWRLSITWLGMLSRPACRYGGVMIARLLRRNLCGFSINTLRRQGL